MGLRRRTVVGDLALLRRTLAATFETYAAEVIARREKCIVALPGGSVATAFFPTLAASAVDWARVEMFWIDERAVPPDHPDSNYAVASRLLLMPARVPLARIHRMPGELTELEQAARRAADELKSIAGDPPHLDLALVGVGDDGHVASIFASGMGVRGNSSAETRGVAAPPPVVPVYDSPKPPPRRLTMALSVLADAGLLVVAAVGASKAEAIKAALEGAGSTTPLARLLRSSADSLVLLDSEAGALIRPGDWLS